MQKVWTLLALVFIAAIFYRVAYVVPHTTCDDIWRHGERRQTDPERADFVAQCVHAVVVSDYFDAAYWKAKAQGPWRRQAVRCRSGHGAAIKPPFRKRRRRVI